MDSTTSHDADDGQQNTPASAEAFHGYAGFWKRFAAACIDGIISFALFFVGFFLGIMFDDGLGFCGLVVGVGAAWLYFARFEVEPNQATPGKMAVGIKVTDMSGNGISFGRACERHFCKILFCLPFLAGFIMAAFTSKKQGLHDICAGCLVVNEGTFPRVKTIVRVGIAVIVSIVTIKGICHVLEVASGGSGVSMTAIGARGKDIYVAIVAANTEREQSGLKPIWPKSGKTMVDAEDISDMTFANSTDYFSILYDEKNRRMPDKWNPYVVGFDYSKLAGAGVKSPETGRLTAKNNMWIIAANVTDDMPDIIPVLITRNIDPTSLIPHEGNLRGQFLRPSAFKTPLGEKAFVIIQKGGGIRKYTWRYRSLDVVYQGQDTQEVREALQKIEYLAP